MCSMVGSSPTTCERSWVFPLGTTWLPSTVMYINQIDKFQSQATMLQEDIVWNLYSLLTTSSYNSSGIIKFLLTPLIDVARSLLSLLVHSIPYPRIFPFSLVASFSS